MNVEYSRLRIVILYTLFAIASIALNLGVQRLVSFAYGHDESLWTGLAAGTGCGFVMKYLLDKRYIFHYRTASLFNTGRIFLLYLTTAVFTTALFWGLEYVFDRVLPNDNSRYIGGLLGLTGGYLLKYQLDKRFVFNSRESAGK